MVRVRIDIGVELVEESISDASFATHSGAKRDAQLTISMNSPWHDAQ